MFTMKIINDKIGMVLLTVQNLILFRIANNLAQTLARPQPDSRKVGSLWVVVPWSQASIVKTVGSFTNVNSSSENKLNN
ncbi:hypothetical protein C0J52_13224 [Blattella germanica]|nr:hypothetical protein C0J52_13224 [Blattella germanica]